MQVLLAALLALASVPLGQAPAAASSAARAVTGTACRESTSTSIGLLGVGVYESAECLTVDASSTAHPYGVAVFGSTYVYAGGGWPDAPDAVTVALDCMVIEDLSWGSRVFASGADTSGARHSVTVTAAATFSGFVAGTADGPAPCGAWDHAAPSSVGVDPYVWAPSVSAGGFHLTPSIAGSNALPTAAFTHRCDGLTCTFDASSSSDPDGSVVSYRWSFGDRTFGSGATATHTYAAHREDYLVRLTVVDDDGGAHELVRSVATGVYPAYTLTANVVKQGKRLKVVLDWTGALAPTVHIRRNATHLASVPNNGSYSDLPGAGTYTYQVCDETSTRCSNSSTVTL